MLKLGYDPEYATYSPQNLLCLLVLRVFALARRGPRDRRRPDDDVHHAALRRAAAGGGEVSADRYDAVRKLIEAEKPDVIILNS